MRASRYDQMNDHGEFQFGVEKLLESLDARQIPEQDQPYLKYLKKGVESFRERTHEVYLVSFSGAADNLEQWRAYCPNGGVAIGFNTKSARTGFLKDISNRFPGEPIDEPLRPDQRIRFNKCRYSDKNGRFNKIEDLSGVVFQDKSFPDMFRQLGQYPEMGHFFNPGLAATLFSIIPFIKHGAYRAEKEWRFVNTHPSEKDYKIQLSETNRYFIELNFRPADCIREVWVSPHGDCRGALNAVEFMKKQLGLSYDIKQSSIPYRVGS